MLADMPGKVQCIVLGDWPFNVLGDGPGDRLVDTPIVFLVM